MTRLTRKCMIASACLHGLLILVLLVGPAFFSKPPQEAPDRIITLVNATITDGPTRGGGNPMAQQAPPPEPAPSQPEPPAPQPTPPPVREPEPPKPEPEPERPAPKPEPKPEPREEPAPVKRAEPVKTKEADDVPVAKPTAKSDFELRPVDRSKKTSSKTASNSSKTTSGKASEPKITLNPVSGRKITPSNARNESTAASQKAAADARRASLARELQSGIGRISSSIRSAAASSTSVDMPGGPGGEAFVNYASIVRERFDSAWRDPSDVADDSANVRVQVVIDRSGAVMSARILSRSGFSTMDKSVQAALDRVRTIGVPFPSTSSDRQRTFIINFNLKSRRLTG